MSHLRAPAARADRREGGRHGRPVARPAPAPPETHIRPQLMRLAVLPPLAVALGAGAAVLFSVRSAGTHTGPLLWAMVAGAAGVTVAGILIAAVAADRAARSIADRVDALRRTAARVEADLHALVDALRQGEAPPQRGRRRGPPPDADDFELLAADLARAYDGAVTAVVRAAQLSSQTGSEQKLEVFVNLARRLQSLVHREISILDDLENDIEDPGLLKGLFHVDHLATRIRRHAENLAVLGGAVSRRQWSNPVSMTEVLRSAIAEVEQYSRVRLVPPVDGELRGHAVADVIHLLAELIENATVFSAPHTQVLLRAGLVTSGLAVEVEDRGLGMPVTEQNRMNALLADPDQVNVASLLADGRIGLYVVSQLARRHGIQVRLQTNIYGGVQAVLVVPQALLGQARAVPDADTDAGAGPDEGSGPVPAPVSVPGSGSGERAGVNVGAGLGTEVVAAVPQPRVPSSTSASSSRGANPGTDGQGAGERAGNGSAPATGTETEGGGTGTGDIGTGGTAAEDGTGAGAGQAPGTGRRRHAQRGSGRRDAGNGTRERQGAGAPPPLPVRGARGTRPNPADAVPGVSAEDRPVVESHTGLPPTPRVSTSRVDMVRDTRDTMDKPALPRRRAQEHIAPQLRGGPVPRQDAGTVAGHDPGLMAAFQRGFGLAEAQRHLESGYGEPGQEEPEYGGTTGEGRTYGAYGEEAYANTPYGHMRSPHMDAPHMGAHHTASAHMAPEHTASAHTGSAHMAPEHMASPHTASAHTASAHTDTPDMGSEHMGPDHTTPEQPPAPAAIPQARTHAAPLPDGARGTGRADGSAPAG
ncbi:ATP-binding protein [Streptomyces rubradiris]|uniref:histidine kinase n=1 Tax=Streptomyces rubradiris TaxID=285531 RepID=A0ABQ3RE32_STRRR|nr:ATP-binding protein [Streptomyces rubradiris]GHH28174.1 ATPase [Streptomyces rubradiris]GHI54077.1 ATPase [Streptomyces rubradiris]